MEKAKGVQLETVWRAISPEDSAEVIRSIASYQRSWMSLSFSQYGSLYYAADLPGPKQHLSTTDSQGVSKSDPKFAVGSSVSRLQHDNGRSTVEFDRGPWSSPEDYASAIFHRESTCIHHLKKLPHSPVTLRGPGTYQATKSKKLSALHCYHALLPYLLPTDHSIQIPCLWHPDLHAENIFVDPSNPKKVTSIIDWQTTSLATLYSQACVPYFLDYEDQPLITSLPSRPPSPRKRDFPNDLLAYKRALSRFYDEFYLECYKILVTNHLPRLWHAFQFQDTESFELLWLANHLFVDGEAPYLGQMVHLEKIWSELPGVKANGNPPFPLAFSDERKAEIVTDDNGARLGIEVMEGVKQSTGRLFPGKGCTRTEWYDESINALEQMKEQVIRYFAKTEEEKRIWEEKWPFDR